jgi:hypothetical protein
LRGKVDRRSGKKLPRHLQLGREAHATPAVKPSELSDIDRSRCLMANARPEQ